MAKKLYKVLIVAKCIVNFVIKTAEEVKELVLIVAKCIVNLDYKF